MQFIPEGLAEYRQFILHTADKQPCSPYTGYPCDLTDPNNWSDGATVLAAAERTGLGIGFVFTDADPFFFFDIDSALTPAGWSDLAVEMCRVFHGCYVEVSRSGTGLHIIGTGTPPAHACKNTPLKLELYHGNRYCALTGTGAQGAVTHRAQQQVEWLAAAHFPASAVGHDAEWTTGPCAEWNGPVDDFELIDRMLASKPSVAGALGGRATVQQLWAGDEAALCQCYPPNRDGQDFDHSSADAALCQHLAFWTGKDCERIDRLFRMSGLYREKWERDNYRQNTVLHAMGHCQAVYSQRVASTGDAPAIPAALMRSPGADLQRDGYQYMATTVQPEHFAGCVYVQDKHMILDPDGVLLKPDQFSVKYGGYAFALDAVNEKVSRNAWEIFTQSQCYNFPKVHSTCFRPEVQPGAVLTEENRTLVNTYFPITTLATPGDPSLMLAHLARMLPDPQDLAVLLAYCAALVQYPGKKFMWAPFVQGTKGNGKSLLCTVLEYCVGSRYTERPDPNDISNKFNAWLVGKLLAIVDEAYVAERRDMENCLKRLITEKRIAVQGKGENQVTADNRANFIINSNFQNAIRIDDNERRYAPFFTAQQDVDDLRRDGMLEPDYFPRLVDWLEQRGGYAVMNHYLRTYQIPDALNPAMLPRAPYTSAMPDAVRVSRGAVEQEVMEAIEEGRPGFAGGWVSSLALDKLLEDRRMAGKIPRAHRRELMQSLSYDWHPALPGGRVHSVIPDAGGMGKPKLYIRKGHLAANLTSGAEIVRVYLEAQTGAVGAVFQAAQGVGHGA